jgi:hypothetical protein
VVSGYFDWVSSGRGEVFYCTYQHANDGDEGDDFGDPPEGEEKAAQHLDDSISGRGLYGCRGLCGRKVLGLLTLAMLLLLG